MPTLTAVEAAAQRLQRDLRQLQREPVAGTSAQPVNDIFNWHANVTPQSGPLAGVPFHLIMSFPEEYPHKPPAVRLCSEIHHPNVFFNARGWLGSVHGVDTNICIDLLKTYMQDAFAGWSSSYSVQTILLQLSSFFFSEHVPQDYGGSAGFNPSASSVDTMTRKAKNFRCHACGHTGTLPFPSLDHVIGAPVSAKEVSMTMNSVRVIHVAKSKLPETEEEEEEGKEEKPSKPKCKKAVGNNLFELLGSDSEEDSEEESEEEAASPRSTDFGEASTSAAPHELSGLVGILDLPDSVISQVFDLLPGVEHLNSCARVCAQWRRVARTSALRDWDEMRCFFTRKLLDECELGIGVRAETHRGSGDVKELATTFDVLSLEAFADHRVRRSPCNSMLYTAWLPLRVCEEHARRSADFVRVAIQRSLAKASFDDSLPVVAYSKLMNTAVVSMMTEGQATANRRDRFMTATETAPVYMSGVVCDKALAGYTAGLHALVAHFNAHPKVTDEYVTMAHRFARSPRWRHKAHVPNLGEFLCILAALPQERLPNHDTLHNAYMEESVSRQARWVYAGVPAIKSANAVSTENVGAWFNASLTSQRVLMFQYTFLGTVAVGLRQPGWAEEGASADGSFTPMNNARLLRELDLARGRAPRELQTKLTRACKEVHAVRSYDALYAFLGKPQPSAKAMSHALTTALHQSERRRYHTPAPKSHK